jgi:hypothetical protein
MENDLMLSIWGDTDQETFGPWTGKWFVHTHGDAHSNGEISVVREDFKHGFRSYGWEGPAKFIVKQWDQQIAEEGDWDILIKAAHSFADQLNETTNEAR